MPDEPFGRQPLPVTVTITGHPIDVQYWVQHFIRSAEFKGDTAQIIGKDVGATDFTIYPRAVND